MSYTILQPNVFMEVWINMIVALPLRHGTPVTLVGRGDHRHTFVSLRDVAAFTVAAMSNPAALDRTIVITGPDALSWRDVVRVAERVLGRAIEVRYSALGEPLPGLPPVVSELATAFETYETVIDTRDVASAFGVRLTSVEEYVRGMLAPVST